MKKIKTISVFSIILLFIIAPMKNSVAQTPEYVGISEGDEYIWEVKFQSEPIENFLADLSNSMDNVEAYILGLDLLGFEDLTIAESIKYILDETLTNVLPLGWNSLNITEFCKVATYDFIEELNETILPGFTPPGWESVNISAMIEMIIEGLNTTIVPGGIPIGWQSLNISTMVENILDASMPIGWENYTLLDTIEFIVNELNSLLFSNIIPSGWEDITIKDLFDFAIEGFNTTIFPGLIPVGWENLKIPMFLEHLFPMIPHELMTQLLESLFPEGTTDLTLSSLIEQLFQTPNWDQITIHELIGMVIPTLEEFNLSTLIDSTIDSINMTMPGIDSINMSDFIDFVVFSINATIPPGMFSTDFVSLNMSTLIDEGIDIYIDLLNASGLYEIMPINWQSISMDELLDFGVSQLILMLNYSTPISSIIPGWEDLTITELIQYAFDLYIVPMVDQYILLIDEQLEMFKQTGFFEYTYGIKITVDTIGTESLLYPDGPSGVPIQITLYYSLDMETWIDLTPMIENALISINITWSPVIYDPTTFPNYVKSFTEQAFSTGLLIIGTNYDWENIDTSTSYELPYDFKVLEIDFRWNVKGVLSLGVIKYGNQPIFSIQLQGAGGEEEIIPGYEIPILIGITFICVLTIIPYLRKKKKPIL